MEEEEEEEEDEDVETVESESEDGTIMKVDFGDLKRAIQEIREVKLNDSQDTGHKPVEDTRVVCYLEG